MVCLAILLGHRAGTPCKLENRAPANSAATYNIPRQTAKQNKPKPTEAPTLCKRVLTAYFGSVKTSFLCAIFIQYEHRRKRYSQHIAI